MMELGLVQEDMGKSCREPQSLTAGCMLCPPQPGSHTPWEPLRERRECERGRKAERNKRQCFGLGKSKPEAGSPLLSSLMPGSAFPASLFLCSFRTCSLQMAHCFPPRQSAEGAPGAWGLEAAVSPGNPAVMPHLLLQSKPVSLSLGEADTWDPACSLLGQELPPRWLPGSGCHRQQR